MDGIYLFTCANEKKSDKLWSVPRMVISSILTDILLGISREDVEDDPHLGSKSRELINLAINQLTEARMVVKDNKTDNYIITELGRIAARYYLRHTSVEIFNKEFRPKMSEADVLAMLSMSTEARSQFALPACHR